LALFAPLAQEQAVRPSAFQKLLPKEEQQDSAIFIPSAPAFEARANSAAADVLLDQMHAAWAQVPEYRYSAQVQTELNLVDQAGKASVADSLYRRSGSVLNGGLLGVLFEMQLSSVFEVREGSEIATEFASLLNDGSHGSIRAWRRANDVLLDFQAPGPMGMGGGLKGLYSVNDSELQSLMQSRPSAAPINFIMMATPVHLDPAELLRAICEQTAFEVAPGSIDERLLVGAVAPGIVPVMFPAKEGYEARLRIDAATLLPISLEIGAAEAPNFKIEFSSFARPDSIQASKFDLLGAGRKPQSLLAAIKAQNTFVSSASFESDDANEF